MFPNSILSILTTDSINTMQQNTVFIFHMFSIVARIHNVSIYRYKCRHKMTFLQIFSIQKFSMKTSAFFISFRNPFPLVQLVHKLVWRRTDNSPLSEPMMV